MFPRYMMITALTILAIVFFSPELGTMQNPDFEQILPFAIKNFIPVGLVGVLVAGLLSAFMSTFAATVNAAPAYVVNDIYKRYIKPDASNKKLIRLSYITSVAFVVLGIGFGFIADSIDGVTKWITAALWGGYAAPNVLKWYWWRFNGFGYFWGMMSGIAGALLIPLLGRLGWIPAINEMESFPFIFLISLAGSIIATLLSKPEDDETLKSFYSKVRPWGFWKPVLAMVLKDDPNFRENKNFLRDMVNVVVGMAWQIGLIVMPMFMVIQNWSAFAIATTVVVLCTIFIKFNWWDKLEKAE